MNHPHLMSTLEFRDVTFVDGYMSTLRDVDGKEYLDFFTDVGTASLGYGSPEMDMVKYRLTHLPIHAPNLYRFAERDRAARRLCEMTGMGKVFFCNSGSEAVEAAIKLARKWQRDRDSERYIIWSMAGGFHGRTYGALATGDGPGYHYDGFEPMPEGFGHFEGWNMVPEMIIPQDAAAVILAPIFGNNDVKLPPEGWLKALRKYTFRKGIVLIFDEVQTGSGRTGMVTYAQKLGIHPDIITLAKGVAMGCPVGVMLARDEVAEAFTPGSHFSTFGGNPLSCAFINGMLDWLADAANLARVERMGEFIREALAGLGWPRDVRGEGMLIAFDVDVDGIEFSKRCLANGLLIGAFRRGVGPVKITPPLNILDSDAARGIAIMDKVYKEMTGGQDE